MTFISALATPRFVFISGDLRVTTMRGRRVEDQSDWATKTMQLDSDDIFGWTGVARIGNRLVDEWVADALNGVPRDERLRALALKATEAFRRFRILEPHALLGAGFQEQRGKRVPRGWIVTNAWDDIDLRFDPKTRDLEFEVHPLAPDDSGVTTLWSVGGEDENGDLTNPAIAKAKADLEALARQDTADPRPIMLRLSELSAEMASSGEHIGASSIVTSLPRKADGDSGLITFVEPPDLGSMQRFAVTANYVRDFRGPHPEYFRQPGLISEKGFSLTGIVSSRQGTELGPDPHRGSGSRPGASFGL
ncbi:hypothetical protein ACRAWB_01435 [Leifsonia poae]|uniref:hypothetical protein n=1 Tax=Leifsonia poae TaxID=110933 RepID=UPI003D68DB88